VLGQSRNHSTLTHTIRNFIKIIKVAKLDYPSMGVGHDQARRAQTLAKINIHIHAISSRGTMLGPPRLRRPSAEGHDQILLT